MVSALLLAGLVSLTSQVKAPDYSERSLCEVWAAAQCHATSCQENGKDRCTTESRRCKGTTKQLVPKEHAEKVAACAKALLAKKCGEPAPAECSDVSGP